MKKKKKVNNNRDLFVFQDLRERYPGILPDNVQRFAPVYYPIAIIQLAFMEETFEDFRPLQQAVLELIGSGMKTPESIAGALGLQQKYVEKILASLYHEDNLIDGRCSLTELGKLSLQKQKKAARKLAVQDYQLDALNGTLIKLGESVQQSTLQDVGAAYAILESVEGVPVQEIARAAETDYDEFVQEQRKVQTNAVDVQDIQFREMRYARCYMLKLHNSNEPIVFAKRIDFKAKEPKERFAWRPLSLYYGDEIAKVLGRADDVPKSTFHAAKYVHGLYLHLLEKGEYMRGESNVGETADIIERRKQFKERAHNTVQKKLKLAEGKYELKFDERADQYVLILDSESFRYRSDELVRVLVDIGRYGKSILTANNLFGYVIRVHSSDPAITELAHRIAALAEGMSQSELIKTIRERMIEIENQSEEIDVIGSLRRITAEIEESDKSDNGKN